ncbi:MAG: hypothetical protein IJK05_04435, partial [Bacteroidales bacterium]|nr:hypothetical protein [Bacteroidales bacterium]
MCPTGAIHGVNFPKPLDKEGIKARVQERQRKAREAAAAAAATVPEHVEGPVVQQSHQQDKKEVNNG